MKTLTCNSAIILLATCATLACTQSLRANEHHNKKEAYPTKLEPHARRFLNGNEDNEYHPTKAKKHASERRLLNWRCVGTSLEGGQALHYHYDDYNEFICSIEDHESSSWNMNDYRLGIYEGRVVMLNPDDEEIWGSDNKKQGTRILFQKGGKLVLLDDDNKQVWAMKHGCQAAGGRIEIRKTGFFVVDKEDRVKWYIDFDGNESGCDPDPKTFPADPCEEVVSYDDPSCRMLAVNTDSYNYEQVIMEVKKLDSGEFRVTDVEKFCWFCDSKWNKNWSSLKPTKSKLSFRHSGALAVNGKTSSWDSCRKIIDGDDIRGYYWEFYEVPGYECNRFGTNLIKTMIDEYEDDDVWGCISDC